MKLKFEQQHREPSMSSDKGVFLSGTFLQLKTIENVNTQLQNEVPNILPIKSQGISQKQSSGLQASKKKLRQIDEGTKSKKETTGFHHFEPTNDELQSITFKWISEDNCIAFKFAFKVSEINQNVIATLNHFAVSHYDNAYCISMVISVNEEQKVCGIECI